LSNGANSVLNAGKSCATITINVSDFYALLHRIEKLEQHIITDRREVLRKELATLEDGFQLTRTYEKRVR
jgi:hypothetical protein